MKGKLIKMTGIYTLIEDNKMIASDDVDFQGDYQVGKLSKQNCDEIFGIVDVEKLAEEELLKVEKHHKLLSPITYKDGVKKGINKAIELNKDKLFTIEDMRKALITMQVSHNVIRTTEDREELIQSLRQPTEIDVEIVMDKIPADLAPGGWDVFPKLDKEGCIILKRVV